MVKTEILKINRYKPEIEKIKYAAEIIRKGGLVAFPTETVYGLGADAFNEKAVKKIFKVKGRPPDNPLIVHIADIDDIKVLAKYVPLMAIKLAKNFWPGPLTIVLKKNKNVSDIVTAGSDSVAVRIPDNLIALSLIRESKVPLVAPSANKSGRPSPTSARDVSEDLGGLIDLILDGGRTKIGIESTVIDMTTDIPTILRPGGVTVEDISKIIGNVRVITVEVKEKGLSTLDAEPVKSPGLKYRHYSPKAQIIIVKGQKDKVKRKIKILTAEALKDKKKIGIITFTKGQKYKGCTVYFAGSDAKTVAKRLFSILREMDRKKVDLIISESLEEKGLGLAVSERLKRAAGFNIIEA